MRACSPAPEGCSTLFVLEPVPNLSGGKIDWTQEAPRMRDRLHGFLGENGYPDEIIAEELVDPLEWQRQGMAAGTPFALAHTFPQTGPFRAPNVDTLYSNAWVRLGAEPVATRARRTGR